MSAKPGCVCQRELVASVELPALAAGTCGAALGRAARRTPGPPQPNLEWHTATPGGVGSSHRERALINGAVSAGCGLSAPHALVTYQFCQTPRRGGSGIRS